MSLLWLSVCNIEILTHGLNINNALNVLLFPTRLIPVLNLVIGLVWPSVRLDPYLSNRSLEFLNIEYDPATEIGSRYQHGMQFGAVASMQLY